MDALADVTGCFMNHVLITYVFENFKVDFNKALCKDQKRIWNFLFKIQSGRTE